MLVGRIALGAGLIGSGRWRHWVDAGLALAAIGGVIAWLATTPVVSVVGLFVAGLGTASLYPQGLATALDRAGDGALAAGARLTLASGVAILAMPLLLGAVADTLGVVAGWPLVIALCAVAFALERVRIDGARIDRARTRTRSDQRRRSPASIRAARRFSGGASGQAHLGSKAHEGWNEKLRSTTIVPAAGSLPRSAPLPVSRT